MIPRYLLFSGKKNEKSFAWFCPAISVHVTGRRLSRMREKHSSDNTDSLSNRRSVRSETRNGWEYRRSITKSLVHDSTTKRQLSPVCLRPEVSRVQGGISAVR